MLNWKLGWQGMADELAKWSWWRFIAISVVILICGSVLDDLIVGSRPHHRVSVSSSHKPAQSVPAPAKDNPPPAKPPAEADEAAAPSRPSISVAIGGEKPVSIDIRGAKNDADLRDAVRELADAISEAADSGDADAVARTRVGWRDEPFGSLSKLLVIALLILKIIGGTRRERQAYRAADAAGAARREAQEQQELAQTRLRQMQAQIEPHFLFNTLAALQRLITTAPDRAATMNRHLIDWLRGSLAEMRQERTNLGQEADLLRSYLSLMQVRFEERLKWEVDIPDGLRSETIPALLLQPLVENAITHGIEPKPEGGMVRVAARLEGGMLQLQVEDSGVGLSPESSASGMGLASVRERLRLMFGERARLTLSPRPGGGTAAEIRLPAG